MKLVASNCATRTDRCRTLRSSLASALLISGIGVPVNALAADAATQAPVQMTGPDIIVYAPQYLSGIQPERDLDEESIAGYDESTIDGLLGEIQSELGEDGEPPLILVNGERVNDLEEIGGLPVEALRNVKVLPRGSAVRAGGTSTQRLVNLTLKSKVRSATLLAAHRIATDGDWNAERGEAILTYIEGAKRVNVTFRVRDESSLLESERDILQPEPSRPFAQSGNVVGFPDTSAEIDPLLSAAAGQTVFVTPVPAMSNPGLADFVDGANIPATTDLGQFRTLRPDSRVYDFNATAATRLAPWLTSNATIRLSRSDRRSQRGLPSALFVLPATNLFSPFSTDVGLAYYGPNPLETRSSRDSGEAIATLNGRFGQWRSNFNARHAESKDDTRNERQGIFGTIPLADTVDPFGNDLFALVPIRTDRAKARTIINSAQLSATGPLAKLPAGELQTTLEGIFLDTRLKSTSDFSGIVQQRRHHRSEWSIRAAADIPIASSANGFLPELGELFATAEAGLVDYSDAGTLDRYALGLTWEPSPRLRLRGEWSEIESPASIQAIGNPIIVTSAVRAFDPLSGETVDVTQLTGGNPDLDHEKTRIWRLSGLLTLVPRLNLQLNAEYTDTDEQNFISSVPEASAAVMLAFPDRFIRDLEGTLTTIDLRPVNFDSHREKRLRYGLSMNADLTSGAQLTVRQRPASEGESDEDDTADQPRAAASASRAARLVRVQLTANHSIVFKDEIDIRPGLGSVDLLEGGAIGIAGGRVRHQLDGTAALTSSGLGLRLGVTWRGKYTLESRIGGVTDTLHFSPILAVNLKAFADLRRFMPNDGWVRGTRVSLNILNAMNDRQEVHDSGGNTPLQYQPGYRDPIGRTIELELRKVF